MPAPTTWTAGLFDREPDDLAEAERQVAILRAELEAIRAGRKEASAAELRKLERDYRDAVSKVQQLRAAAAPERPARGLRELAPSIRGPGAPTVAPAGRVERPRRGIQELAPSVRGPGPPPGYQLAARPGTPTPRVAPGAPPPQFAPPTPPTAGLWRPPGGAVGRSERIARESRMGRDPYAGGDYWARIPQAAGGDWRSKPMNQWTAEDYRAFNLEQERKEGAATEYQAGSLEARQAEAEALQRYRMAQLGQTGRADAATAAYRMAQLGQGQAAAGATAAWRQQQAEQAQAQLKQAWMVAQGELAHAQNLMASQIGTSLAGTQGQMWAQGLPHALPRGTTVAPGFERGGPMSQLYRMSGSQFQPGRTGRISPQPPPSQQQLMQWVQQAMGQFGAGR